MPERANYYDIGVQQKISREFTIGLDTYAKQSTNLIDEGQFGAPIILTPFNYRYGRQYGAELTANYTTRELTAYLNLSAQSAKGKLIDSAQFNFSPADLEYIASNYIHLDHEQQRTASGGASYLWHATRFSADFLMGSGLRADLPLPPGVTTLYGGTGIPNGEHLPYYTQINLGLTHAFTLSDARTLTARFDVINAFDADYQIRNGTGIGVGAPHMEQAARAVFRSCRIAVGRSRPKRISVPRRDPRSGRRDPRCQPRYGSVHRISPTCRGSPWARRSGSCTPDAMPGTPCRRGSRPA